VGFSQVAGGALEAPTKGVRGRVPVVGGVMGQFTWKHQREELGSDRTGWKGKDLLEPLVSGTKRGKGEYKPACNRGGVSGDPTS